MIYKRVTTEDSTVIKGTEVKNRWCQTHYLLGLKFRQVVYELNRDDEDNKSNMGFGK